jgi:DNA-binding protein YbaB
VAVPTNHRDEVAQLLAEYRRGREQLASVQRTLTSIAESATSPDGLITVTVDAAGTLSGLSIADEAYRRHRPTELAAVILRTTRSAGVRAAERARQALAPVLPADIDPAALLSGRADLTEAEIAVPAVTRPASLDEDSYEETSWMGR